MRNIHHGFTMTGTSLIMGYVFFIMGIAMIFTSGLDGEIFMLLVCGIGFAVIGGWMAFSTYGMQIDSDHHRFREYGAILGIKYGKWKQQSMFPYMAILGSRKSSLGRSYTGVTTSMQVYSVDLYFLTENHRGKVVIKEFPNSEKAIEFAQELKEITGARLVKYSPEISEKTKARRRR